MSIPDPSFIERFSHYKVEIKSLYNTDSEFASLWDDYCKSKMTIDKYDVKLRKDVHIKREYEDVVVELEKEIIRYVTKGNGQEIE